LDNAKKFAKFYEKFLPKRRACGFAFFWGFFKKISHNFQKRAKNAEKISNREKKVGVKIHPLFLCINCG